MFLSGVAIELIPSSNNIMFPLGASLPVAVVHPLLLQKFPPSLLLDSLRVMLVKLYGNFGFGAVSAYEDITSWVSIQIAWSPSVCKNGPGYKTSVQMMLHFLVYINKESKINIMYMVMIIFFVGMQTWQFLWIRNVLQMDAGTASIVVTAAWSQLLLGTLGGMVIVSNCSITAQTDATTCIQATFQSQLYSMSKWERFNVFQCMVLIFCWVLQCSWMSFQQKNVVSTQAAISYGSKEVPEGVVYVFTQLKKVKNSIPPIPFFIQHDLTLVKYVWDCAMPQFNIFTTIMEMLTDADLVKKNLQPVFNGFGCDDLTGFLEQKFPLLRVNYMDQSGVIYPWPPMYTCNPANSYINLHKWLKWHLAFLS